VTALDGTRVEGYVREQDGVAAVEPDGLTTTAPSSPLPASTAARPASPPPRTATSTMRNGFTRLR
jgi:hypothetical protein